MCVAQTCKRVCRKRRLDRRFKIKQGKMLRDAPPKLAAKAKKK